MKDEIIFSVFCKYPLNDASYRKRPLFKKHTSFNYASIGIIPETIRATGESLEHFEVMAFLKAEIILSVFCKYLLNNVSYRKRPLFMKYSPLNYASVGGIQETIGAKGLAVRPVLNNVIFSKPK